MLRPALAFVAAAGLALAAMPAGQAHCDPGTSYTLLALPVIPSLCPFNDEVELATGAAGDVGDHQVVVVVVKDQRFHPEVVQVRSGGTVLFVYADVEWTQAHDPQSSGPCADSAADPSLAPKACTPTAPGRCFAADGDLGAAMDSPDDLYALTFRATGGPGVEESHGALSGTPVVGEPPLATPFRVCPAGSAVAAPAGTVIPYHCGLHGGAATPLKEMRGAIVVV